jgi:hypothetical protein
MPSAASIQGLTRVTISRHTRLGVRRLAQRTGNVMNAIVPTRLRARHQERKKPTACEFRSDGEGLLVSPRDSAARGFASANQAAGISRSGNMAAPRGDFPEYYRPGTP